MDGMGKWACLFSSLHTCLFIGLYMIHLLPTASLPEPEISIELSCRQKLSKFYLISKTDNPLERVRTQLTIVIAYLQTP